MNYISDIQVLKLTDTDWSAVYAGKRLLVCGDNLTVEEVLDKLGFDVETYTTSRCEDAVDVPAVLPRYARKVVSDEILGEGTGAQASESPEAL